MTEGGPAQLPAARAPTSRGSAAASLALRWVGLSAALLLASSHAALAQTAATSELRILVDGDSGPYRRAVAALKKRRPRARVLSITSGGVASALEQGASASWVALGPRSARQLAKAPVPRKAAALVQARDKPDGLTTVSLLPPLTRQLELLQQGFPGRTRLLVLKQKGSSLINAEALTSAGKEAGVTVEVLETKNANEGVYVLERALRTERSRTLVWLLPDRGAVTSRTVPSLVRLALTGRVPLVGFSGVFLKAGAHGALVSDYGRMALQALALAEAGEQGGQLVTPSPTLYVQQRLASRLGITTRLGDGVEAAP